jgi:hypothetical protein
MDQREKPTAEQAQIWANSLRSGKHKQTAGCLQDNRGYCCLGVAYIVFVPKEMQCCGIDGTLLGGMPLTHYNSPKWLADVDFHFKQITDAYLSTLNDDRGYTFDEIADLIELVYVHEALN